MQMVKVIIRKDGSIHYFLRPDNNKEGLCLDAVLRIEFDEWVKIERSCGDATWHDRALNYFDIKLIHSYETGKYKKIDG